MENGSSLELMRGLNALSYEPTDCGARAPDVN